MLVFINYWIEKCAVKHWNTRYGFCACALTFQLASTTYVLGNPEVSSTVLIFVSAMFRSCVWSIPFRNPDKDSHRPTNKATLMAWKRSPFVYVWWLETAGFYCKTSGPRRSRPNALLGAFEKLPKDFKQHNTQTDKPVYHKEQTHSHSTLSTHKVNKLRQ